MIQKYNVKLVVKKKVARRVYFFRFRCLFPQKINFKPGQYLILKVPTRNGVVSRLYSIASIPNKGWFELIVKLIDGGIASRYFENLSLGKTIVFYGPAGLFTWRDNFRRKILIATGTGIVPFWSMLSTLGEEKRKIPLTYLFWGLANFEDIFFEKLLKEMVKKDSNFHYQICLSRAKSIGKERKNIYFGRLTKPLINYLREEKNNQGEFYLCGRHLIVEALKTLLLKEGIREEQIFFEKF